MNKNNYLSTSFDLNSEELVDVIDELPFWSAPFGIKLLETIAYRKGITVLDIGCGTGFPLIEIAMRLGNACKVYGLDPWDIALKRVEKKIQQYNIRNIEIIRGDAENIPLESNSIDLIISNNGLNNVADIEQSLRETSRIIKTGGQLIEARNLEGTMLEFYSVMESVLKELNLEESIESLHNHIYNKRMPINKYIELLKKNEFSIESVAYEHFDYRFTDGTTMFNHHLIRLAFLDSWKSLVPEEKQHEIFEIIENRINKQSQKDDIFKLSIPFAVINCKRK